MGRNRAVGTSSHEVVESLDLERGNLDLTASTTDLNRQPGCQRHERQLGGQQTDPSSKSDLQVGSLGQDDRGVAGDEVDGSRGAQDRERRPAKAVAAWLYARSIASTSGSRWTRRSSTRF